MTVTQHNSTESKLPVYQFQPMAAFNILLGFHAVLSNGASADRLDVYAAAHSAFRLSGWDEVTGVADALYAACKGDIEAAYAFHAYVEHQLNTPLTLSIRISDGVVVQCDAKDTHYRVVNDGDVFEPDSEKPRDLSKGVAAAMAEAVLGCAASYMAVFYNG